MLKTKKTLLAASIITASALSSGPVLAEISANIGITSNYIVRGVTETNNQAAIQGGLDFEHESGFYVGTWASNVDWSDDDESMKGYEVDVYLGFAGEVGDFGYDVGYIRYMYPSFDRDEDGNSYDAAEFYIGGSYSMFSAMAFHDPKSKNRYFQVGMDFDIGSGFGLGLHAGTARNKDAENANDYAVTVSKEDFTFTVTTASNYKKIENGKNYLVAIGWSKSF